MKKQYRFEILRRGDDRFYWLFVVLERRRRRVLARSTRDYGSAQKAKAAIAKLQRATNVVDTTDDPFSLPETHFRVVPGVVPLMVEEFPVVDRGAEEFIVFGRAQQGTGRAQQGTPDEPTGEPVATKTTAKPSASRARKPAARRGSRAARGSGAGGGEPSASR